MRRTFREKIARRGGESALLVVEGWRWVQGGQILQRIRCVPFHFAGRRWNHLLGLLQDRPRLHSRQSVPPLAPHRKPLRSLGRPREQNRWWALQHPGLNTENLKKDRQTDKGLIGVKEPPNIFYQNHTLLSTNFNWNKMIRFKSLRVFDTYLFCTRVYILNPSKFR